MTTRAFNGDLLLSCRRHHGLSADALAKKVGLKNGQSIRDAERGKSVPRDETIKKLCEVFTEVGPDDFWSDISHPSVRAVAPAIDSAHTPTPTPAPPATVVHHAPVAAAADEKPRLPRVLEEAIQAIRSGNESAHQTLGDFASKYLEHMRLRSEAAFKLKGRREDLQAAVELLKVLGDLLKAAPGAEDEIKLCVTEVRGLIAGKDGPGKATQS